METSKNYDKIFRYVKQSKDEEEFLYAVINHKEPICPKCHKGRIVSPSGKSGKPHYVECTNNCGWYMNIDYNDCLVE